MTGAAAEEESGEVSPFAGLDRPVVVYVWDPDAPVEEYENLEEVVFKSEKVGLGMKAFRAVKMTAADAEADPLLTGHGRAVPRLLVVDPAKERIKVLEKTRLKVSALYSAMKSVARNAWEENLDKVVKAHLKLLTERDQLANELKVLDEKRGRADGDREREEIDGEIDGVRGELETIAAQERDLWKLTPKERRA